MIAYRVVVYVERRTQFGLRERTGTAVLDEAVHINAACCKWLMHEHAHTMCYLSRSESRVPLQLLDHVGLRVPSPCTRVLLAVTPGEDSLLHLDKGFLIG